MHFSFLENTLFLYRNRFYKNVKDEINQNFKIKPFFKLRVD